MRLRLVLFWVVLVTLCYDVGVECQRPPLAAREKFVTFDLSEGLSNQAETLERAALAARALEYTLVLPCETVLRQDGGCKPGECNVERFGAPRVRVDEVWDVARLSGELDVLLACDGNRQVDSSARFVVGVKSPWREWQIAVLPGGEGLKLDGWTRRAWQKAEVLHFAPRALQRNAKFMLRDLERDEAEESRAWLSHAVQYSALIRNAAQRVSPPSPFHCVHWRASDFAHKRSAQATVASLSAFLEAKASGDGVDAVLLITDAASTEGITSAALGGRELVRLARDEALPFGDLWGPVEQLVCAKAARFIGSNRSTFSTAIQRMRGEYGDAREFLEAYPADDAHDEL